MKVIAMRCLGREISWQNRSVPVRSGIFFVCLYLYIWFIIEPRLIYHSFGTLIAYPAFWVDWLFLKSSLSYPGGVAEYMAGFLSQLYYFSWLGALIVTVVAWLMFLAVRILTRLSEAGTFKPVGYIPVLMLLVIHNRYDNQLTSCIALLAALWFSVLYEKISLRSRPARAALFLVMFAILYYIAGGASFIFALLAMIYELFVGRRRILGMLFLTVAIGTYLVGRFIYDLEADIFHYRLLEVALRYDLWVRNIVIGMYIFLPLVLLGVGLRQNLLGQKGAISEPQKHDKGKTSPARQNRQRVQSRRRKWALETVLLIVIAGAVIFVSFESTRKKLIQVDYYAHQKMWPEVLATAKKIPPESYNIFCIHDVNRALSYTGRLGEEMFGYPQKLSALIFSGIKTKIPYSMIFMKKSQLFLEFGHVGSAEREAFEFMELVGNSPYILEQLATIKLVKGQTEAAKVFLRALSKDLIFGRRGREMLERLEEAPELTEDKTMQHLRALVPEKENVFDPDVFFQELLDKKKDNKLAFDYMMAYYLLAGQVDNVAANLGRLRDFGYWNLPRYYEEAMVIYMSGGKKTNLLDWMPSRETIEQAKAVDKIYQRLRGTSNQESLRKALAVDFGDSYFSYYILDRPKEKE